MNPTEELLKRIDRYLAKRNMSPTAFGRLAANDPRLVHDMREGRELRTPTRERIHAFLVSEAAQ